MFGVGFTEILLILLVTLIVFGPEKIPEIARDLARIIASLRNYSDQIKQEIGLDEFTKWRGRNDYYTDFLKQTALPNEPLLTPTNSKINNSEINLADHIIPDVILPKQEISEPSTLGDKSDKTLGDELDE